MAQKVRIGLIGAGGFTLNRMVPALAKMPDVELTAVANRSRASAEKVAAQFGVPEIHPDYRGVVESPNVDAVLIGAPPYVHRDATIAALEAGKHVLCQTRIATTVADARAMYEKGQAVKSRGVRTMLVPPAPFYRGSRFVDHLLKSGEIGILRHVLGFNMNATFAYPNTPLSSGRNDPDMYGRFNAMQLGLSYDVMARWTGHAKSVIAQRGVFVPERPLTPDGPMARNPYPDEITVIADTESGAVAQNLVNYSAYHADSRVELYGSEGTIVYRQKGDTVLLGKAGDEALRPVLIPAEHDGPWLIEEEFIRLIRGEIAEPSFTFWDGVKNLQYLEAAYYAATEGRRVEVS